MKITIDQEEYDTMIALIQGLQKQIAEQKEAELLLRKMVDVLTLCCDRLCKRLGEEPLSERLARNEQVAHAKVVAMK